MSCAAFKLRFGVIGTNFISDWLLEGAAEDSRFEVAALANLRESGVVNEVDYCH